MSRRKPMASRSPCGRIVQKPSELLSPTEVRRLTEQASLGLRDPVWSTQLGRVYLAGRVSASEFSAGKYWREVVVGYSIACQSPKPPRTVALDASGGTAPDPDSEVGKKEARRHVRAVAAWLDGRHALRQAGAEAERVVETVCIKDLAPAGFNELGSLRAGLMALSAWWSATRRKR